MLALWLAACNVGGSSPEPRPVLQAPFEGTYRVTGVFDHAAGSRKGRQLDAWGKERRGEHGHLGWDWAMPYGTPIYAAAEGIVSEAGLSEPFFCPISGEYVEDQVVVRLFHRLPEGRMVTAYAHLRDVTVEPGQKVEAGQLVGHSGNSGCSTGPHLHFGVWFGGSGFNKDLIPVDPFGWMAPMADPYAALPHGAPSVSLWRDGKRPPTQSKKPKRGEGRRGLSDEVGRER